MRGVVILISMILSTYFGFSQEKPQKVESIIKNPQKFEWYVNQYSLWEREIEKDKKNEESWINFYTAARMARISNQDEESVKNWYAKEVKVIEEMDKSIKGTFAYYRILAWHNAVWNAKNKAEEDKIINYSLKAHELNPNDPAVYPDLMNIYEVSRPDLVKQKELSKLWKASADHTPKLMALSYNALMNTRKEAILLTGGDNDTYPLWIAQHADGFRPDVNVWNVYLMGISEYRNRKFNALNIPNLEGENIPTAKIIDHIVKHRGGHELYLYNKGIVAHDSLIFENLYNVGVVYQYSEESMNNIALIVDHFENKFILDQLKFNYYQSEYPEIDKIWDYTYLPGLVSLFKHYKMIGNEEEMRETQQLINLLSHDNPYFDEIKQEIGLD